MNPELNHPVPRAGPDAPARVGRFRVLGELGRGGMGLVYRAHDPDLGREVALKVLLPELATDPRAKARFLREARAQARVEHDHVTTIHDVGEAEGFAYIVMPLLKGRTLRDALAKRPRPPVPELVRVAREAAEGLSAAHAAGLVHRDIKPGNIWLEAPKRRVKILDFGLARATDAPAPNSRAVGTDPSLAGAFTGTPAYMSPEQARGDPVDARSDVFSLGVVLYEMATGRKPFAGANQFELLAAILSDAPVPPAQLAPDLPPALADLISRMLAKDPAARPQNCERVSADLDALALVPVPVVPSPSVEDPPEPNAFEDLTAVALDTSPDGERTAPTLVAPRRGSGAPRLWGAAALGVLVATVAVAVVLSPRKEQPQAKEQPPPERTRPPLKQPPPPNPSAQLRKALLSEAEVYRGQERAATGSDFELKEVTRLVIGPNPPPNFFDTVLRPALAEMPHLRALERFHEGRALGTLEQLKALAETPAAKSLEAHNVTPGPPLSPETLGVLKRFPNLASVALDATGAGDAALESLSELRLSDYLGLTGLGQSPGLGEAGLRALGRLKLEQLTLARSPAAGAALKHLAAGQYRVLRFHQCGDLTDDAIEHLARMKIDVLELAETGITAAGEDQLRKALPRCAIARTPKDGPKGK